MDTAQRDGVAGGNGYSANREPGRADLAATEPAPVHSIHPLATRTTTGQILLGALGTIAFLYFARPVVLPIFLACVAGMTLKPLIRWMSYWHLRPAFAAAI